MYGTLCFSSFTVEAIGCFWDSQPDRALPVLLKNVRKQIDWYHMEKTVATCSKLTQQQDYKVSTSLRGRR